MAFDIIEEAANHFVGHFSVTLKTDGTLIVPESATIEQLAELGGRLFANAIVTASRAGDDLLVAAAGLRVQSAFEAGVRDGMNLELYGKEGTDESSSDNQ